MNKPRFFTNFKYTSREDKTEYVWRKYREILQGEILDVGADQCGLKKFLPRGTKYIGIGLGGAVDVEIDLEKGKLPYEENSFDCVLCLDVLEHLDNMHDVFDELCRVTGKYLIISLPNPWAGFTGMFKDGYNCVMFREDLSDFAEKLHYVLSDDSDRERVIENAYRDFIINHTYEKRIEKVLDVLFKLPLK